MLGEAVTSLDAPGGRGDVIVSLGLLPEDVKVRLERFAEVVVVQGTEDCPANLSDVVALVARGASIVDAGLIARAPRLRVIGRSGVGVELVDLDAATRRGIPVVVTPGSGSRAVAEGAFALTLSLVKRLGRLTAIVHDLAWSERETVPVGDLDGACLGIVGFGRIGRRVAELGSCFGMEVLAYDPYMEPPSPDDGVTAVSLEELFERADVVSLHAPLTEETRGMVDAEMLGRVRRGTILVNCGRGGLLNLDAAYDALCDGRLAGVGLDVFDREPPRDHLIFRHPDVVLTPHVLGLSHRARQLTFEQMADGMIAVLAGGRALYVANPEAYEVGT